MTISERQFECFCKENDIPFTPLSPGRHKTPDYEVILSSQRIIVEVKELTPNEEEKQASRDFWEKRGVSWGFILGNRIRYKLDDSKRQIERLAAGKRPGILLLYDTRPILIRGITPYEIKVAMYGFETIDLHVPKKFGEPVRFGKHRFGKGKKLRYNCHTFISAVGVLQETSPHGQLHVDFYLNVFAEIPLPVEKIVTRANMAVYTLIPSKSNEFREWKRVLSEKEYAKANNRIESDEE